LITHGDSSNGRIRLWHDDYEECSGDKCLRAATHDEDALYAALDSLSSFDASLAGTAISSNIDHITGTFPLIADRIDKFLKKEWGTARASQYTSIPACASCSTVSLALML